MEFSIRSLTLSALSGLAIGRLGWFGMTAGAGVGPSARVPFEKLRTWRGLIGGIGFTVEELVESGG